MWVSAQFPTIETSPFHSSECEQPGARELLTSSGSDITRQAPAIMITEPSLQQPSQATAECADLGDISLTLSNRDRRTFRWRQQSCSIAGSACIVNISGSSGDRLVDENAALLLSSSDHLETDEMVHDL